MLIKCFTMSNNARPGTVAFEDAYDIYYSYLETQISVYLAMTGILCHSWCYLVRQLDLQDHVISVVHDRAFIKHTDKYNRNESLISTTVWGKEQVCSMLQQLTSKYFP